MTHRRQSRGFTLLELLVVVGLIAALTAVLIGGLGGGGKSAALQSAQATMANLVTAARVKAMATGQSARVLVHVDQNSTAQPVRFMHYVALQVQVAGVWQLAADAYLPDGVYVVPGNFATIPAGLFATNTSAAWVKSDGSALRSTALRSNQITAETINSATAEQWVSFSIAAAGTTAQWGDIILAAGKLRAPGSYTAGESPIELENPEAVRGVTLSIYGVPALVNGRTSF
jgi:prepilin-type N-terminal cleavage/methylation domain-containing protein